MKALVCEMCAGKDLVKQDGLFVCQNCGCKYTVEEARKLMIEGTVDVSGSTVKVDASEKLNNLLVLATRARKEGNSTDAKKYYEMAMLEDPTNWESAFYSSYYTLMDSPVGKLQETLKNFNSRAVSTLELIFSDGFNGNVHDTVSDFFASTATLYTIVTSYTMQSWMKEYEDAKAKGIEELNRRASERARLYENARGTHISVSSAILNLCSIAERHKAKIDASGIEHMYELCDTLCEILAAKFQRFSSTESGELEFLSPVLRLEAMRREDNRAYVSKAIETILDGLRTRYQRSPNSDYKNEILVSIRYIEDQRAALNQARTERYWNAHPEEKAALVAERHGLEDRITALRTEISNIPGSAEVASLQERIRALTSEKNSLGLFKGKEKKLIQEKIDAADLDLKKIVDRMNAAKKEIEEKIAPIQGEIDKINTELATGR